MPKRQLLNKRFEIVFNLFLDVNTVAIFLMTSKILSRLRTSLWSGVTHADTQHISICQVSLPVRFLIFANH